ncbi:nucleotide-diphospho-sugar transferase [Dipodascopsis tothii]|uniref:nucleotide-diphospho-sugar transferase n=1 Tax=Dipodascopsis tothii TaxID=44089 RepID=UPI0034CD5163
MFPPIILNRLRGTNSIILLIGAVTFVIGCLHFLLQSLSLSTGHGSGSSLDVLQRLYSKSDTQCLDYNIDDGQFTTSHVRFNCTGNRENAAFVMLVRNSEVHDARSSIRHVEDRFNKNYGYPWIFLNDLPFSDEFVKYTSSLVSGEAYYGIIDRENWEMPEWIDRKKAKASMQSMEKQNILYGGSESYRHMCRFFSGFFYKHELVSKYDYYWRVEPNTEILCDVPYDPFKYMRENQKKYGFVISLMELYSTIQTLWPTVQNFSTLHPEAIHKNNALGFIVDNEQNITSGGYNLCHFWSNFEIAAVDFWKSEAYENYFTFLDKTGGFYYERWGDAPVHSIAAAILLDKTELHWFDDFGYKHHPFTHCPERSEYHESGRCTCNPKENFDNNQFACKNQYLRVNGDLELPDPIPPAKLRKNSIITY